MVELIHYAMDPCIYYSQTVQKKKNLSIYEKEVTLLKISLFTVARDPDSFWGLNFPE